MNRWTSHGARVFLDGHFFASIPVQADLPEIDETRLDGESWLDMRERTGPLRDALEKRRVELASIVAKALNNADIPLPIQDSSDD